MLKRIVAVAAGALVVGCSGLPAPGGSGGAGGSGPIRVGLAIPTTGGVAASGADMLNGWNLYWKQKGARIGNRTVETLYEDTGGDPTTAITNGRQLVEQRQVHMLLGPLLANEGYALAD